MADRCAQPVAGHALTGQCDGRSPATSTTYGRTVALGGIAARWALSAVRVFQHSNSVTRRGLSGLAANGRRDTRADFETCASLRGVRRESRHALRDDVTPATDDDHVRLLVVWHPMVALTVHVVMVDRRYAIEDPGA